MSQDLELLQYLSGHSSPTVANAIEQFKVRPQAEGFSGSELCCLFPDLPPVCGYAVTLAVNRATEAGKGYGIYPMYEAVAKLAGPKIVVIKDLSGGAAAFAGEIMAATFARFGVKAIVTDGLVRDLDEVHALKMSYFARGTVASHGDLTLTGLNEIVEIAGLQIKPGDILHGDKHGLVAVPAKILPELPRAIEGLLEKEKTRLALLERPDFSLEMLKPK
jgi:4-hydroxy-4-methyl-2-oxoglutarate aldolase